jgi:hypothetical protein
VRPFWVVIFVALAALVIAAAYFGGDAFWRLVIAPATP